VSEASSIAPSTPADLQPPPTIYD